MLIKIFIKLNVIILLIFIIVRSFTYIYKNMNKNENTMDIHFKKNSWENNYMFAMCEFNKKDEILFEEYIERVKTRNNKWEKNMNWYIKYNVSGIIEINNDNTYHEIMDLLKVTTPPKFDSTVLPFKIIFLKKEYKIIILLNHYHCDGNVLHDIIIHNIFNTEKTINFIKYKYYPIISDLLLYRFLIKSLYIHTFKKHDFLTLDTEKSIIVRKDISYNTKIDRWIVFSKIINILFKYLKKDSIKVAFTVGFDDNVFFCKNRIGVILITIPRMNSEEDYLNYIKKMITKNKYDAICSYDLFRNFPISLFRKNMDKTVDVVLTSFKVIGKDKNDCDLKNINYDLGSFIGIGRIPIYICSMTLDYDKIIKICIKSTTPDFDSDKMIKNEPSTTEIYKW
jgi:hypothetical protein